MAEKNQPSPISLHQCLFGYDDGHRLLASSTPLPEDVRALLLVLSDLVPGIKLGEKESYWTGIPLHEAKQYVLMRTWSASEISRPGCVWTHVIMIGFADVARFVDLGILRELTVRPVAIGRYDDYGKVITLEPASIALSGRTDVARFVNPAHVLRLIRALYSHYKTTLEAKPGELDEALFALWSQQWPRLRRSFTFRTAASKLESHYSGIKFDIRLIASSSREPDIDLEKPNTDNPWEAAALEDICSIQPTAFRRFLWRYGSDLNCGYDGFRVLADIYVQTHTSQLNGKKLDDLLATVAKNIPNLGDGLTLKEDLVACGSSKFSLLPPADVVDMLAFFACHPEINALPLPPQKVCTAIQSLWQTRLKDILRLAERFVGQNSTLGDVVLENIKMLVEPATFLKLTGNYPSLRQYLIALNPALLISEELIHVPCSELLQLINIIPKNHVGIADKLLAYLLRLDDADIVQAMLLQFPNETLQAASEALRLSIEEDGPALPRSWYYMLEQNSHELLSKGIIESACSTRFLSSLANLLGYDSAEVMSVGPRPWITALQAARDDVNGSERQIFLAFLLAMVIRNPASGSELIFERAFETVNNDLWHSRLPQKGMYILNRHLPNIGWLDYWDTCKRLQVAVVSAYVNGNLDSTSFYRLTYDWRLQHRLTGFADKTKKGRLFLKGAENTPLVSH